MQLELQKEALNPGRVAPSVEASPQVPQKVLGGIPGQAHTLVAGLTPRRLPAPLGRIKEGTDRCFSLTSMSLYLCLSLPSCPSKINKYILR